MPGYDRTGPRGEGPMTGRGRGYCGPGRESNYMSFMPRGAGRGFPPWGGGRGRVFGGGRGRGFGRGYGFGPNTDQEQGVKEDSKLESIVKALGDVMNSTKEVLGFAKGILDNYRKAKEESEK